MSGPPLPAPGPADAGSDRSDPGLLDRLPELPVAQHAPVFEAEHERLQRQLATIDHL